MNRTEREKDILARMVRIYCRNHSHPPQSNHPLGLCEECAALLTYALRRIDCCPQGAAKTTCRLCPIHCYSPLHRERIRAVMRYVGPRMMLYHPVAAIRHLVAERLATRENRHRTNARL